jgi:hypothetical protein
MNHLRSLTCLLALGAALIAVPASRAHDTAAAAATAPAAGTLIPVTAQTDPAWLAQARASYPLDACVVSGDKFDGGDMGKQMDYVYRQAGRPDRLVRMCCKDCITDFNKDPAKYLKAIDAAAAAKAKA